MKQLLSFGIIALLIIFACADLERDNLLDPKNPLSSTEKAVLVELFINDSTGYDYCEYAVDTIEEIGLRDENQGKLFVLEYHVNNPDWNDAFALNENTQRYHEYVPSAAERGIPDAFFNGREVRVQGASQQNVYSRYSAAVDNVIDHKGYFIIEAEKNISGNALNLDVTVARLGNSEKKDLAINAVVYEDLGIERQRFVVRKILPRQIIGRFDSGQIKRFKFSANVTNAENIYQTFVLVFLQDQSKSTRDIYQSAKF